MAYLTLNLEKLRSNYTCLDTLFKKNGIAWAVVTKILCGNKEYLAEVLQLGVKQVCDSRITNLKNIKQLNPDIETIYIKPPARNAVANVVRYADISMNTEIRTIEQLSVEAVRQQKKHRIIIMLELGELREGVMGDHLINFYSRIFKLENIEVAGIGTNLSCLYGVLPNQDKLIQLSLYKQLIEAKFNRAIPLVSGGSSVTIPMLIQGTVPRGINHFRVGDSLFLGSDVYNNGTLEGMHADVFSLHGQIIELTEKPAVPSGEMGSNVEGHSFEFDDSLIGTSTCRAIVDIGLLDVEENHITALDPSIQFAGASSDMLVLDLGANSRRYKVGDWIDFSVDYMGALRLLNSRYIDKKIIRPDQGAS